MLKHLEISNYALIENVVLKFQPQLTVITGETGAGKSIILKALGLILGERAETAVIRQNDQKCVLEAHFEIHNLDLEDFFQENDLDFEPTTILRREFNSSGKSRAFINDSPVSLNQLKDLGEKLVKIHSQHQTLLINTSSFQFDLIDSFSGIDKAVNDYKKRYQLYRDKVNRKIELQVQEMQNRKEKDYLEFLISELNDAGLKTVDEVELRQRQQEIENIEKIKESLSYAQSIFENDDAGPKIAIKELLETFQNLKGLSSKYADVYERFLSLKIELDDLDNEVQQLNDATDFDEEEAAIIQEKFELINSLLYKHNVSDIPALIELKNSLDEKLNNINDTSDLLEQLEREIDKEKTELEEIADQLHQDRESSIAKLTEEVKTILNDLSMSDAELFIDLQKEDKLGINGWNSIDFKFNANKGGIPTSVKKVASGGELSRLMLAVLKIISQRKQLPTMIFDEIDTGVSGEVASKMGKVMKIMGDKIQIITITHLPQVAALGEHHLFVSKSSDTDKTTTEVKALNFDERVDALAQMISGTTITEAAKENAVNLLKFQ